MSGVTGRFDLTLPEPLRDIIHACEVVCVAGCCGLDAFEFQARHIVPLLLERGCEVGRRALDQLEDLCCRVGRQKGAIVSDESGVNHVWRDGEECLPLTEVWQREMVRALRAAGENALPDPAWLRWNGGTVLSIARTIQKQQSFGALPILADALQEAGCQDEGLLAHCRETREHFRSCWVVEILAQEPDVAGTAEGSAPAVRTPRRAPRRGPRRRRGEG